GKLKAKRENRVLEDMVDIQTACQQACPTEAIVFGNANDKDSRISTTRHDQAVRLYRVIEAVHTLPNITYLAKIRHADVAYTAGESGDNESVNGEKHS
ncbi:MAG TPA: hypothetical protein VGS79_14495, partial [Puia sp.]|nr:hypothetical protein [Puia sp.]